MFLSKICKKISIFLSLSILINLFVNSPPVYAVEEEGCPESNLVDLPSELIDKKILIFLVPKDQLKFAMASKTFHDLYAKQTEGYREPISLQEKTLTPLCKIKLSRNMHTVIGIIQIGVNVMLLYKICTTCGYYLQNNRERYIDLHRMPFVIRPILFLITGMTGIIIFKSVDLAFSSFNGAFACAGVMVENWVKEQEESLESRIENLRKARTTQAGDPETRTDMTFEN
jgi:hypothetical protein